MQSGGCRVSLGAIPYWAAWSEGQVVFSVVDSLYGHGSRIVVSKRERSGLLYVNVDDNLSGCVAASHIRQAVELAESVLGPDHFASLESRSRYYRHLPLFKLMHFGGRFGWKSGLLQMRGRYLFGWGVFSRRARRFLASEH